MTVHTHAQQGARPGPDRKAVKQLNERLRREQRELAEALRELAAGAGGGGLPGSR